MGDIGVSRRAGIVLLASLLVCGASAQTPELPEPVLPKGLAPYVDHAKVQSAIRSVSKLLRAGRLTRNSAHVLGGDYIDAEYPKRYWDAKALAFVAERSPCESDAEAMAVHRGWAWIAVGYNLFGRTIESRQVAGSKFLENTLNGQSIDLDIARHGRSIVWRTLQVASIGQALQFLLDESRLPVATRADIVAFLRTLRAFKSHHDLLVSQGDSVRAWMYGGQLHNRSPGVVARDLVQRINGLLSSGDPQVTRCLEGYVEHVATLEDGRRFESGSIYSGGIAIYSLGFWWRREGEGTAELADAVLRYVIGRLER